MDAAKDDIILTNSVKTKLMSRKRRILVLIPCALALFVMASAGAAIWTGAIKLRVTAEQANIRERPDITSAILQQLPQGTILEAERKEGEWYAVPVERAEGGLTLGYVHESLVVSLGAPPPSRPREPTREKEPPAAVPQVAPPPIKNQAKRQVEVAVWIGARHASVGDLNDGADGLARYYESQLLAASEGNVGKIHFGFPVGAEVRVALGSGFYVSIGAEHCSMENSSTVTYKRSSSEATYSTKPELGTTPLNIALVFYPLGSIYLRAGLDYTFARCAYFYRLSYPDPYKQTEFWQEWRGKASSSGFGYQLGLGFERPLTTWFSLLAECAYRRSRFDDFEGENIYRELTNYESREEGTLYRITASAGGAETFPLVFIRNRKPAEAGVMEVRRAELNLSGLSLRFGLKIRL